MGVMDDGMLFFDIHVIFCGNIYSFTTVVFVGIIIIHQKLLPNRLLPSPPCICSSSLLFCPLLLCKTHSGPPVSLRSSLRRHPGFEDELRREKEAGSSTRLDGLPPGPGAVADRSLPCHSTWKQDVCNNHNNN